jgi:hypothetical protein
VNIEVIKSTRFLSVDSRIFAKSKLIMYYREIFYDIKLVFIHTKNVKIYISFCFFNFRRKRARYLGVSHARSLHRPRGEENQYTVATHAWKERSVDLSGFEVDKTTF